MQGTFAASAEGSVGYIIYPLAAKRKRYFVIMHKEFKIFPLYLSLFPFRRPIRPF